MTWYKDINSHILEGNNNFRLIYCPLCKNLITKANCDKLKQNCKGELYPVKRYYYQNKLQEIKVIAK